MRKEGLHVSGKRKWWTATGISVLLTCLLLIGPFAALAEEPATDYSAQPWLEAFGSLHSRISAEYAFTEWKGVDWDALGTACREKIQQAEADNDFNAYYVALRQYGNAIPDGHVRVSNLPQIDDLYVGGGFGFAPALLSDGSVIACWVDEASDAYRAGIRAGDALIRWNGEPFAQAAQQARVEFATNSATEENAAQKRVQYIARAPVGTAVTVVFEHPNDNGIYTANLTAYADKGITLQKNYPDAVVPDPIRAMILNIPYNGPKADTMVAFRLLEGNIAYIRVLGELDIDLADAGNAPSTLALFRAAVQQAVDANAAGLILDIRNNVGGLDDMTAAMLGSFYTQKTLFEYQNVYDSATGTRSTEATGDSAGTLYIEPAEPSYTGRVIALINQKCLSCGEGLAMGIHNLKNGDTLGFYGTNGSFGLAGAEATMPGGFTVSWPSGQSLGADRQIQLDSRNGVGGVAPTIRVPMTAENALKVAQGEDVELAAALAELQAKP